MKLETLRVTHWTLPGNKAQLRAAHLSDLHLHDNVSIEWLQFLVRRIAAEQPDLILFTGDFTATRAAYRSPQPVLELFAALDAPMGKFAVRGNHDRKGAAGKAVNLMEKAGFRVLENEAAELKTPSGEPVIVGGLAPMEKKEYDVRGILWMKSRADALRFLLIHEPMLAEKVPAGTADVLLAGHTHQGQCHVPRAERLWLPKHTGHYVHGEYRVHQMPLYVSAGLGESRLSMRWNAPRELVIVNAEGKETERGTKSLRNV